MSSGFDALQELKTELAKETEIEFKERPKHKILSRGTEVNRELVIEKSSSIYEAIHVAARTTRRILVERRREELDPYVSGVDGLKAIENGEINPDDRLLEPTNEWRKEYYTQKLNEGWFWYR